MLGTFRLLLALFVAFSHANGQVFGLNPGVIAVVCFYLISGYVMSGLLHRHYPGRERVGYFYLDRLLRLFPQYLLIAAVTLLWYFFMRPQNYFLGHTPGAGDLLNNLLVIPLNYYMFNGSDTFTLLPPAWSLGAELQFYLLMPLLLLFRLRIAAFVLGLLVFCAATAGFIDSNIYGYRLLPGVLTFFLLGSLLFERERAGRGGVAAAVAVGLTGLAAFVFAQFAPLALPYKRETLLGLAIGVPLLVWLARLPQPRWDSRLGDLSYGVFLNHFLIQWTLTGAPTTVAGWCLYFGASVLLSFVTQSVIERPVLAWRRRLRSKEEAGLRTASGSYSG